MGLVRGEKLGGTSLETDDSPQSPLLYRSNNVSLRKGRAGGDLSLQVLGEDEASTSGLSEDVVFTYNHSRHVARLDSSGLTLTPLRAHKFRLFKPKQVQVPFSNVLSVDLLEKLPWWLRLRRWLKRKGGGLALSVHAAQCSTKNANLQRHAQHILICEDPAIGRGWAAEVNTIVRSFSPSRPRHLLVIVNPKSGSGKAKKAWTQTAQPILQLAGVDCVTLETQYAGHARQYIEDLGMQDLEGYDGILAVGGDGMFKELIEGIIAVRRRGGAAARAAENLRLAQIPAGSTDAVAWTINATRSAETAALHVASGQSTCLDVMRVDSGDGRTSFSVCYASYGYMGDLLRRSERMRFLGAVRYTLSGIIAFLMGKSYAASITYVPAHSTGIQDTVCKSGCDTCSSGIISAAAHDQFSTPAAHAMKAENCRRLEGIFRSIMVVVTPCRSDMSPKGLSPHSHLSDGRIQLIIVRACSQLQYLHFMSTIPRTGIQRKQFPFVEILDVSAARVIPQGHQSSWNVDGELLKHNCLEAQIHRGLIRIFSGGLQ